MPMLFYSFFKTLVGKEVIVELKDDMTITGVLHSVDQYLNIKLTKISVADCATKHQHMYYVAECFIRGSVIRYIQLNPNDVDVPLLQDACRKEAMAPKKTARK